MDENASVPRRIVLDAGPIIALLYRKDRDHRRAVAGFQQLADAGAVLIAPLPIVFEVYKWILYEAGPMAAQSGLRQMRASLEVLLPRQEEFEAAVALSGGLSKWAGTLEDAVVALAALSLRIPVWTLNYRDLGAFPRLRFWNPT